MNTIKNQYQLSKTLRFGLTLKEKTKKNDSVGEIYESHRELKDLLIISADRMKDEIKQNSGTSIPVEIIKKSLDGIKIFLENWENIYSRTDQIALDKDFYKKLTKKIGFEGFWYEEIKKNQKRIKKPQSREIKLSELKKKDKLGKERKEYIIEYWESNLQRANEKLNETVTIYEIFNDALTAKRDDLLPNEVEMRKIFLSLTNIVNEVLRPLCNGSVTFPNIEKLIDSKENKNLRDFALDDDFRSCLLTQIEELRIYFSENGGNVPYCRATLNPKTAIKNPESTNSSINNEVIQIGIEQYLQNKTEHKNKFDAFKNENLPLIERALLFKYKTIPAVVQFDLAKVLAGKTGKTEQELRTIIRTIGQPQSPAKDYAELKNKNEFNLQHYPLKVAFDFAWESLAKAVYHPDIDFPERHCKQFLKDTFKVEIDNNIDFKLYAQLIYLRELLATLEHSKPTDTRIFVQNAEKLLGEINWSHLSYKYGLTYKKNIAEWLKTRKDNDEGFQTAKQQIGLIRGGLKNKIKTYHELTETYKCIAMQLGKKFASMRDKITGAAELSKISHYATIIEDRNNDKYLLIEKITGDEKPSIFRFVQENEELKTYSVNSITSAAISKMIRKIRTDALKKNGNNKQQNDPISEERKEAENLLTWGKFIREKQWDKEFNLNLNIDDFEKLKKEIDAKCYQLKKGSIDKKTLANLVKYKQCLLFPIINQDLAGKNKYARNQFTKDWQKIFSENPQGLRLTPEFRISFRRPTPLYPKPEEKRYSRFQVIAHFMVDFIPQHNSYISIREQIATFKDDAKQKDAIKNFHDRLNPKTEEEQHVEAISALQDKFGPREEYKTKNR